MDINITHAEGKADTTRRPKIADRNTSEALSPEQGTFRRRAENRTNRALEAIGLIGNLSNRHIDEYEEAEIRKIIKALRDAVVAITDRFNAPKTRTGAPFKL